MVHKYLTLWSLVLAAASLESILFLEKLWQELRIACPVYDSSESLEGPRVPFSFHGCCKLNSMSAPEIVLRVTWQHNSIERCWGL